MPNKKKLFPEYKKNYKVFVYGTLMQGMSNHCVMEEGRFISKGEVKGVLYDLGMFPAAVRGGGVVKGGMVKGELWEVSGATLMAMDSLEGHPGFYTRVEVPVSAGKNSITTAWCYFRELEDVKHLPIVSGGDWRNWADKQYGLGGG